MKKTSIILRMLLIVGLIVSPLYPRAFAANGPIMTMSGTDMISDEMSPCADGKMDCDKTCMVACMSLHGQCLPSAVSTVIRAVVVGQRFAIHSEAQLASLAAQPPARPPRA